MVCKDPGHEKNYVIFMDPSRDKLVEAIPNSTSIFLTVGPIKHCETL